MVKQSIIDRMRREARDLGRKWATTPTDTNPDPLPIDGPTVHTITQQCRGCDGSMTVSGSGWQVDRLAERFRGLHRYCGRGGE